MQNFRQVMEPFTASKLKVTKKNVLKDFVSIASFLNVSHVAIFTKTDKCPYFRLCRMPRGPTITYKIVEYSLSSDVVSIQKRSHVNSSLYQNSPLLVLNGFSNDEDIKFKLMTSMWRNMFPSIDIHTVQLNKIKRCVLLHYDQKTGLIEFRHYAIKIKPVGLSRMVKKLMTNKKVPNLGSFASLEEAMENDPAFTESEGEMDEDKQVTLPQKMHSRGSMLNEKSSIKLVELGPRMKLELVKIEEGLMDGEVLFHNYIQKSEEDITNLKMNAQKKAFQKLSRKKQQEENIKKKLEEKEKEKAQQRLQFKKKNSSQNGTEQVGKPIKTTKVTTVVDQVDEVQTHQDGDEDEFSDYQLSDDEMVPLDDADEIWIILLLRLWIHLFGYFQ